MLSHVGIFGIGHGFRMLFGVLFKVARFSPILLFFILIFSIVFHNLFQNQDPLSHIGVSIMKIMAMSIGELDFSDTFFDDSNIHTLEIVAFLMFVLLLAIMTISMMNLLIGLAIPDVEALSKQGDQDYFRSKMDIILQYLCMMPWMSHKIHSMTLGEIYKWEQWKNPSDREKELEIRLKCDENVPGFEKKFEKLRSQRIQNNRSLCEEFLKKMEKKYMTYKVSPDENGNTLASVEELVHKSLEKHDLFVEQCEEMKKQIWEQSEQIGHLNDSIVKQNETMNSGRPGYRCVKCDIKKEPKEIDEASQCSRL